NSDWSLGMGSQEVDCKRQCFRSRKWFKSQGASGRGDALRRWIPMGRQSTSMHGHPRDMDDEALATWAEAYGDQTEADHAVLVKAVKTGPRQGHHGCLTASTLTKPRTARRSRRK